MEDKFEVEADVVRNVAALPIVVELCRGPRFLHELVERLEDVAAPQTIQAGVSRLIIAGYVSQSIEPPSGIRKRYALTDRGRAFAGMRVENLVFGK